MRNLNFIFVVITLLLSGCSVSQNKRADIYDMQAVQEYNARIYSGNTVSPAQKVKMAAQDEQPMQLNASDTRPKVVTRTVPVVPTIGVGYYHGFRHHHW